jgi:eukaryotic-like serine/threonine-protein kinase
MGDENNVKLSDSHQNVNIRMEKRDGETYIALGLFIVAIGLPVILGTYWAYMPGNSVSIVVSRGPVAQAPDLAGQARADVEKAVEKAGLAMGNVVEAYSATVASGKVISQDPAAGASLKPDSKLNIVVSRGKPFPVKVPAMVGHPRKQALWMLEYEKLALGTVTEEFSSTVPAGSVIGQSIAAGSSVLSGTAVDVVFSKGPVAITAPSIVGQTLAQARPVIEGAGLLVGPVSEAFSATVPAGCVITQNPAVGGSIATGAPIMITLSKGKGGGEKTASVPGVTNQTKDEAAKVLASAGLKVAVEKDVFSDVPAGTVISQEPAAGSYLEAHVRAATVNIVCAIVLMFIGVGAIFYGRMLLARNKRRA